jgi:hypothetical protein
MAPGASPSAWNAGLASSRLSADAAVRGVRWLRAPLGPAIRVRSVLPSWLRNNRGPNSCLVEEGFEAVLSRKLSKRRADPIADAEREIADLKARHGKLQSRLDTATVRLAAFREGWVGARLGPRKPTGGPSPGAESLTSRRPRPILAW